MLIGCSDTEKIVAYRVKKLHKVYELNHGDPPDRTLAAIVLWKNMAWFFKLSGTNELVGEHTEAFMHFMKSVRFDDAEDATPTWTTPPGWQQEPGTRMRFATLVLPSVDVRLELTVIPLPLPPGKAPKIYELENINRWRMELGLGAIENIQDLEAHVDRIDLANTTATVMNKEGRRDSKTRGRAPFASRSSTGTAPAVLAASGTITYETPEGWLVGKTDVSRGGITIRFAAAFEVVQDGKRVGITISKFPVANPLRNINRWRNQIGHQDAISPGQLEQMWVEISVDDTPSKRIELNSPEGWERPETIFGVITTHANWAWFIKLKGDQALAAQQRQNFNDFLQSIRFPSEG